jgi:hypothetical protein
MVYLPALELLDSLAETDIVFLADEADHVAAGVAAEAVVKVGLGIDGKGRGLLLVEGTEADVVGALFLELHTVSLDDGPEVMGLFDRLDLLFRYFHEKAPFSKNLSIGKLENR